MTLSGDGRRCVRRYIKWAATPVVADVIGALATALESHVLCPRASPTRYRKWRMADVPCPPYASGRKQTVHSPEPPC
jgi:hypothetical protein